MRAAVYPDQWEAFRAGKIASLNDGINSEMFYSLVADVERLAGEAAPIGYASTIEDPVLVLGQQWGNVMVERGQLENRDDENPKHPDVLEDERLHDVQLNIEAEIARGPTHTAAGVAVKLRQLQRDDEEFDGDASWRPAAYRTALGHRPIKRIPFLDAM